MLLLFLLYLLLLPLEFLQQLFRRSNPRLAILYGRLLLSALRRLFRVSVRGIFRDLFPCGFFRLRLGLHLPLYLLRLHCARRSGRCYR